MTDGNICAPSHFFYSAIGISFAFVSDSAILVNYRSWSEIAALDWPHVIVHFVQWKAEAEKSNSSKSPLEFISPLAFPRDTVNSYAAILSFSIRVLMKFRHPIADIPQLWMNWLEKSWWSKGMGRMDHNFH